MKTILLYASIFILLTTSVKADEQSDNFAQLIGTRPTVEINLGPTMLSLLSSASKDEDGIAGILSSLSAINVTVFELDEIEESELNKNTISSIRNEINKMADTKVSLGYEKIAKIKEDDSLVYVFTKMDQKKLVSLSIYALDDEDELVLININGDILMSQIGDLMEHFDVDLDLNGL